MCKNFILLGLYILFSQFISAQLGGIIEDVDTNERMEYATAALYNELDSTLVTGVISDATGLFIIEDLRRGSYYIEISFVGYELKTVGNIQINNRGEAKDLGTISLAISNQLNEVVVRGNEATVINKIDRQVFDAKQFQNAQGGTATDLVKNLPSISVDGLGEISVRGSTGFVVLLNGKPVQGNASTILNQLPANAIERVEVVTAPSAKYDPEGKAGILNIITKKGAVNGTFAQVNLKAGLPSVEDYDNAEYAQRYGVDATYNIRNDQWNISLGANYQRNDLAGRREGDAFTIIEDRKTQFPSDGERSFDEVNYSGRFTVDFTPDSTNTYSLGFYAGKRSKDRTADILYYDNHAVSPVNSTNRLYTLQYFNENLRIRRSDFVLGSFDYAHIFKNNSKFSTSFLYEYTLLGGPTTNRNLGYPDTSVILQDEFNTNDNPLNGIRFLVDYAFTELPIGTLETGYQYRNLDHTGNFIYERRNNTTGEFELVPEFSSEVDLKRSIHSGYLQLTEKKKQWEYAAGVRLEVMDRDFDLRDKTNTIDTTYTYDFVKLYPSASLQYTSKNETKYKLAYSKRVERTTTFKMNPFPEREHSETLEQGDPTLLPEFIDLVEAGVSKSFNNDYSVYATAFFRNTENLVNRVNTVYNDTILNRIYSNVGRGRALGLEIGSQLNPTEKWSNFLGATIYNNDIQGTFDGRSIDQNAMQYVVNANSTFNFSETSSLQFSLNYLSARKTAQGEDSEFYSPNLTFRKSFLDGRLVGTLQWLNMDLGLLNSNQQRITTSREGEFFTSTNYVYEVDMFLINLSYSFNKNKNKSKFIESEFGKREF